MFWKIEAGLSDRFFKDPVYWRNVPLSELCRVYRLLIDEQNDPNGDTRRFYTDKKGKKHVSVKVLDAE